MENFSERLRELRKANNLGQKEVGAWIGVSDSQIKIATPLENKGMWLMLS